MTTEDPTAPKVPVTAAATPGSDRVRTAGPSLARRVLSDGFSSWTLALPVTLVKAFRRRFLGSTALFYLIIASLVIPSILGSLGVGLIFNQLHWDAAWYSSSYGAQLTLTLPFALLIMVAVLNRLAQSCEETARDQGANPCQVSRSIVLPLIATSLIGIALFGFWLSYDEFARTPLTSDSRNTLPLEIYGMATNDTASVIFALGTLTTVFVSSVIGTFVVLALIWQRRRARQVSDANQAMV